MMKIVLFWIGMLCVPAWANGVHSTLIYDPKTDSMIQGTNLNITRPIASLTKIMTALVALDHDPNMDRVMTAPTQGRLPPGPVKRQDLFAAMLIRSDNAAADALAADYPGGKQQFVKAMNRKAQQLGMSNTRFVDSSGLSAGNVASIWDVSVLLLAASAVPVISQLSVMPKVEYKKKNYTVILENTNLMLLTVHDQIQISKTGFTRASGWSLGMIIQHQDRRFVVVILGAESKQKRYDLAKKLIQTQIELIEMSSQSPSEINLWQQVIDYFINLRRSDIP